MGKFIFEDLPSTKTPLSAENLNTMQDNLIDLIYPIGSIFFSTTAINPNTYLGGTWKQIKDVFLLSAGETYEAGTTGGQATHTLTIEEMPSHTHEHKYGYGTGSKTTYNAAVENKNIASITENTEILSSGGSKPFNIMPPYLTVYMWERIS